MFITRQPRIIQVSSILLSITCHLSFDFNARCLWHIIWVLTTQHPGQHYLSHLLRDHHPWPSSERGWEKGFFIQGLRRSLSSLVGKRAMKRKKTKAPRRCQWQEPEQEQEQEQEPLVFRTLCTIDGNWEIRRANGEAPAYCKPFYYLIFPLFWYMERRCTLGSTCAKA